MAPGLGGFVAASSLYRSKQGKTICLNVNKHFYCQIDGVTGVSSYTATRSVCVGLLSRDADRASRLRFKSSLPKTSDSTTFEPNSK